MNIINTEIEHFSINFTIKCSISVYFYKIQTNVNHKL